MKIFDWITDGHKCQACGDFFPKIALITLRGYGTNGVFCTLCAKEIIDDAEE